MDNYYIIIDKIENKILSVDKDYGGTVCYSSNITKVLHGTLNELVEIINLDTEIQRNVLDDYLKLYNIVF